MTSTPPSTKGKSIARVNAISFAALVEAMLDGTMTCRELAEHTGLNVETVSIYVRAMHKRGAAYIDHFECDSIGRMTGVRVFRIGREKDAKYVRLTHSQRQARARNKRRSLKLASVFSIGNMDMSHV